MKHAITLFTVVAVMFIALGANRVLEQQQQLAAARPIPGTILTAEARPVTGGGGGGGGAYAAWIRYRYAIGDQIRTNTQLFPRSRGGGNAMSEARARRLVAEFPPGRAVTVWYVPPKDPFNTRDEQAFLVREWGFEPYLIILLSMIHLSVGMGLWAARPWRRKTVWPPRATGEGNWHALTPRVTLATRRHPWRAVTLAWYVIGGVAIGHYVGHADRPYPLLAVVASSAYAIAGVFPLARWLYYRRFARVFRGDPRVLANTDAFRLGKTFDVRVEQAFRRRSRVESVRLALVCDEVRGRTKKGERPEPVEERDEVWAPIAGDVDADRDRPLTARAKLTPPADDPPSTPPGERASPRVTWRIVVEVKVARRPAYREDFPITVVAAK